jgi:hypothetical protein
MHDAETDMATTTLKLYFVFLHLRVQLGRVGGKARMQSTRMKLVLQADSEVSARTRAERWFEHEISLPTARFTFGSGSRDGLDVRLDEHYGTRAVDVFVHNSDVVVLS